MLPECFYLFTCESWAKTSREVSRLHSVSQNDWFPTQSKRSNPPIYYVHDLRLVLHLYVKNLCLMLSNHSATVCSGSLRLVQPSHKQSWAWCFKKNFLNIPRTPLVQNLLAKKSKDLKNLVMSFAKTHRLALKSGRERFLNFQSRSQKRRELIWQENLVPSIYCLFRFQF